MIPFTKKSCLSRMVEKAEATKASNKTVVGASSLNTFKNSLDKLWSNQDLLYNNHRAVMEKKDYILTGSNE